MANYRELIFFDKTQQREGISGVLSEADYEARFTQILK